MRLIEFCRTYIKFVYIILNLICSDFYFSQKTDNYYLVVVRSGTQISTEIDLETSLLLPIDYLRMVTYTHKYVQIFQDYIFKKYSEHHIKESVNILKK